MNCSICTREKIEVKFFKNGYPIIHCNDCGHLYTDHEPTDQEVAEIYSDDYFFKGEVGYENYLLEKDMLIKRGEYYANKVSKYIVTGKVLDIGAAAGFILKGFENKGWKGTGIEPNKFMVDYGKHNLGLDLIAGTIETVELQENFDLIIFIQVAAHIYDLESLIKKISNNLNPGGQILFETWDKDSWTSRIFGKHWHQYSPPSTLNYYSKKTLNHFMQLQGFSLVVRGVPKKKILSQHAKSLLNYKLKEIKGLGWLSIILKIIPDNIMLPYPSEDLFWALYKK
ncbi:class I SAM-dependent methyltransferase [Draconibacterium sp.]